MLFRWSLLSLALPTTILATSLDTRGSGDVASLKCLVIEIVVDLLRDSPTATQFCESLLAPTTTTTTTYTKTHSSCAYTNSAHQTMVDAQSNIGAAAQITAAPEILPTPAALLPYPSSEISEACKCLSIPSSDLTTRTSTKTATSTTTLCPVPTTCGNEGVQWAYYQDSTIQYNSVVCSGRPYTWDPTDIKSKNPPYTSTTSYIFLESDGSTYISIYGSTTEFETQYIALNHRGYIYAEVSGDYTFTSPGVDDIIFFWSGPKAVSGWTESNADATNYYCGPGASFNMPLLSGQYYPFRIVYANAETNSFENITITAPDGTVILGATSPASPYIVQYSCDGTSAPPFPAFGDES
ncbi:hypothetical protein N7474_009083 [Penicillium riverlandense]|uniref:uncharacterized protein n=1 Tax=Penicillium riverlandense TaxID=1903569 RepID=UPI0025482115|nr:uncharacterized protein N7474_009083 [Penicillium riverlandense]KAJ5807814.1 hypothetical protein N7474_009083 [Penicillium riverlandense]